MESSQPLKQALSSEPEPQTNPESFTKLVKDSGKKQLAFIVAFLIIAVVLGGTVFAYTQLVKKEDKGEDEEVIDQSAWKKCEINDPVNIEIKVPNKWNCDTPVSEGESGTLEGWLELKSPEGLKVYFGIPGPLDTRGESFEELYLQTKYVDYTAHTYMENEVKKLAMLYGNVKDTDIVSWVNTNEDKMPQKEELDIISSIVETLVIDEKAITSKTFSITKAGKTFEFEYDVNYYAEEEIYETPIRDDVSGGVVEEISSYYINVYDIENIPSPDYPFSVVVIIVNKEKELEGGIELPENLSEGEGLLMTWTANQCFSFDDKKYFESTEGERIIKASGKFDCVFPVEDGSIDSYNTEALAYGVSLDEEYYAVIYIATNDVVTSINEDLLNQIARTIKVK